MTLQMRQVRGKNTDRRKWQVTLVFLPGKSHKQRSLVSYNPWGLKQLNMTEQPVQNIDRKFSLSHTLGLRNSNYFHTEKKGGC